MQLTEFPSWLASLEPRLPLVSLVEEINNLYHSFAASSYDREHPEIFDVLPLFWEEMVKQLPPRKSWHALDFGCGTGFEAAQVLRCLNGKVGKLVCYDPSPEMLAQCSTRLRGVEGVVFCAQLEEAQHHGPFELLLTNSLLHHLSNIPETINSLLTSLTPDAMWLAGHEPSARFYRNAECAGFLEDYSRYRRWAKFVDPEAFIAKTRRIFGRDPLQATAKAALRRGWFKKLPSPLVIDRIVDFHVPHTPDEANSGRGLDFEQMQTKLAPEWSLKWIKTYAFFGPFNPTSAPLRWANRSAKLADRFPLDGANFSMVWARDGSRKPSGTAD